MNNSRKLTLLSLLGATLEYYDFIIYGMMTPYLTEIFFTTDSTNIGFLKAFSVLAIGYFARPIGGLLFGLISDRFSRKQALLMVMSLMAVATTAIGLLPNYQTAGVMAPVLLTFFRFLQGLSFGAEIPGISSIIKENNSSKNLGKYFGLVMTSTSIGSLIASLSVFLISHYFTRVEIIDFAWRIPFLCGAMLSFVIYTMRNNLLIKATEDPHNLHVSHVNLMKDLFQNHLASLVASVCITLFFSYLIILTLFLPVYLSKQFDIAMPIFFATMTIGIFVNALLAPFFGYMQDLFPKNNLITFVPLLFIIFLFFALQALHGGSFSALIIFIIGYEIFISLYATICLTKLSSFFPSNVRATGIGLSYNLAFSLASTFPLVLNLALDSRHHIAILLFSTFFVVIIASLGNKFTKYLNPQDKYNTVALGAE